MKEIEFGFVTDDSVSLFNDLFERVNTVHTFNGVLDETVTSATLCAIFDCVATRASKLYVDLAAKRTILFSLLLFSPTTKERVQLLLREPPRRRRRRPAPSVAPRARVAVHYDRDEQHADAPQRE